MLSPVLLLASVSDAFLVTTIMAESVAHLVLTHLDKWQAFVSLNL